MRQVSFPLRAAAGLAALLIGLSVAMLLGGWGWSRSSTEEDPQAARAVHALVEDRSDARAELPGDFADVLGYRPVVRGGRVLRADGGCSSPWGPTRYGFGTACKQHDLGYDLLRYASLKHQPLGTWARRAIDQHFSRDVLARCSGLRCRDTARVYTGAVDFNSWRQGWGVPVVEGMPALLLPGFAGFVVASAGLFGVRRRTYRLLARLRAGALGGGLAAVAGTAWATSRPWLEARAGRLLVAASVLALCLQPVQVARPVWVQAVIGGAAAAQAYLLTCWLRVFRRLTARSRMLAGSGVVPALTGWMLALAGGMLALAAVSSSVGQLRLDAAVGREDWSPLPQLLATPAAVFAATGFVVVLVGSARMLARTVGVLLHPDRVARGLGVVLLFPGLALGVVTPASAAAPDSSIVPSTDSTSRAVTSSGGTAGSVARSAAPGRRGREFLAGATLRTYRTQPVRVYVGRNEGHTAHDRAALAVERLRRAGGFNRPVLLVAVPTGSGWVNSIAVSTLEQVQDGDLATVAVQYAASPSWVSYVRGGEGVQDDVRELLDAIHAEVLASPAGERPEVLVYGESLGAWGGLKAYPTSRQLLSRVDGALWVGVPPGVQLPVESAGSRQLVVIHPDDPVPSWTPELMVHPTPGYPHGWLPGVSFWRVTADVISANTAPIGHGHRYGPELAAAWSRLVQLPARR